MHSPDTPKTCLSLRLGFFSSNHLFQIAMNAMRLWKTSVENVAPARSTDPPRRVCAVWMKPCARGGVTEPASKIAQTRRGGSVLRAGATISTGDFHRRIAFFAIWKRALEERNPNLRKRHVFGVSGECISGQKPSGAKQMIASAPPIRIPRRWPCPAPVCLFRQLRPGRAGRPRSHPPVWPPPG